MHLLLLSNSRAPDGGYLTFCHEALAAQMNGVQKALFVPFAGVTMSWDDYTAQVQEAIAHTGVQLVGAHQDDALQQFLAGDLQAIMSAVATPSSCWPNAANAAGWSASARWCAQATCRTPAGAPAPTWRV